MGHPVPSSQPDGAFPGSFPISHPTPCFLRESEPCLWKICGDGYMSTFKVYCLHITYICIYMYIHTHVDKQFTSTVYFPIYCCFYVFEKKKFTAPRRHNLRPATRARGCLPRSDSSPPRPSGCHRALEITGHWDFTVKHGELCLKKREQDI